MRAESLEIIGSGKGVTISVLLNRTSNIMNLRISNMVGRKVHILSNRMMSFANESSHLGELVAWIDEGLLLLQVLLLDPNTP